jgi:hypothetical protein
MVIRKNAVPTITHKCLRGAILSRAASMRGHRNMHAAKRMLPPIPTDRDVSLSQRYVGKKYHSGRMCPGVLPGVAGAPTVGGKKLT